MNDDTSLWLIFILIGLATTLPRASFIVFGQQLALPATWQRALRYAPAAALAAIVVPDILLVADEISVLNPKIAAALAAAFCASRWRSPWLPFIVGMAVLLALKNLI